MNTDERIAAARAELAVRLRAPQPGTADKERERLSLALKRLGDRYTWDESFGEAEYRREMASVRAQLAALPSPDGRMLAFDQYGSRAAEMRSFSEMVEAGSGDKLQELVPWLIARVETAEKHVARIVPTESARPFFTWLRRNPRIRTAWVWRPRTDSNRRRAP